MFAHKKTADVIDEYYQLAQNTLMEWMKWSMHDVIAILQPKYFQEPTRVNVWMNSSLLSHYFGFYNTHIVSMPINKTHNLQFTNGDLVLN
jgi:hypothetical protein